MPRDMGSTCRKRQLPDGLQSSSSLPKRPLSASKAEVGSSINTTSGYPSTTPHGSLCVSASSALINSDCSTSICPAHSGMFLDVASFKHEGPGSVRSVIPSDAASSKHEGPGFVLSRMPTAVASSKHEGPGFVLSRMPTAVASSKHEGPGFVLSRIPTAVASSKLEGAGSIRPCDTSSYNPGAVNDTKESLVCGKGRGIWSYRSHSTKGLDSEGELSEVTSEKRARTHGPDGASGSGEATHVISRRDVSSLNSKDELWWYKTDYGHGDYASRGKKWESSSLLYSARQRRYNAVFSMASESASSCATADSLMEEVMPKPKSPHIYLSVCKEAHSRTHTRAEVLAGPRSQEIIVSEGENIIESSEVLRSSTRKVATEEVSPSYVLSSGRMSLEEEARLGRRAPTIDHDFEEYFSSLML